MLEIFVQHQDYVGNAIIYWKQASKNLYDHYG